MNCNSLNKRHFYYDNLKNRCYKNIKHSTFNNLKLLSSAYNHVHVTIYTIILVIYNTMFNCSKNTRNRFYP